MNLSTFIQEHKAVLAVVGMNVVHFAHLAWPRLVAIFPYCRENGGAFGIAKQFLWGKPVPGAANSQPGGKDPTI